MKKKSLLYFLVGALSFTSSCTDEAVYQNNDEPIAKTAVSPYRIPLEEALSTAEGVLNDINPKTRGAGRRVASVDYVGSNCAKTRSGASDTLFYLVNYEDNGGFAMLSADRRLAPVYAISDEGHLEMSDTIDNPPLSVWMNAVITTPPPIIGDSVSLKETVVRTLYTRVNPYFRGRYRNLLFWKQDEPFNEYCPTYGDGTKKSSVGCVALATGMVMAYNCWPEEHDSVTYNWTDILRYNEKEWETADPTWRDPAKKALRKFLRRLGDPEYLNMSYGINKHRESSAYPSRIPPTFEAWGYERPRYMRFTDENAILGLSEGPIIMSSSGKIWDNEDNEYRKSDHAWVMDGYMQYRIEKVYGNPDDPVRREFIRDEPPLYHCVWGWNNGNNGFYYWTHDDGTYLDLEECEMRWPDDKELESSGIGLGRYTYMSFYYHFKPIK